MLKLLPAGWLPTKVLTRIEPEKAEKVDPRRAFEVGDHTPGHMRANRLQVGWRDTYTAGGERIKSEPLYADEVYLDKPTAAQPTNAAVIGTVETYEGGKLVSKGPLMAPVPEPLAKPAQEWIECDGVPMPISGNKIVELRLRDGSEYLGVRANSAGGLWGNSGKFGVTHYRLVAERVSE